MLKSMLPNSPGIVDVADDGSGFDDAGLSAAGLKSVWVWVSKSKNCVLANKSKLSMLLKSSSGSAVGATFNCSLMNWAKWDPCRLKLAMSTSGGVGRTTRLVSNARSIAVGVVFGRRSPRRDRSRDSGAVSLWVSFSNV